MRIGLDASCLPPLLAGAGRYICGLITALSTVDKSNEYFIFLKQRDLHWVNKLSSNFKLIVLPNFARPVRIAWQITRPHQLVTKYHLDVWHAPHYILPMNLKNVYSVVTFHDMIFFRFPEFYTATKRWFFQTMIQDAVARADAIVAVSKTTKDDIHEIFGTLPDKLNHIYSGSNGEFQPVADRETLRRVKLKFNTGEKYILFVGTFEKRKNLTLLLQAFHCLVHNGYSNIKLVMVGQKENGFDEINHTIESLGLANRVVLPGYVVESDLPALYSAASLFVYPSHYEGFGFPVLEAMACGTPVLTSNISAMKELSGHHDMQVSANDVALWSQKMQQALSDETLRHRMTSHGLNQSRKFNWRKTAYQMIEIYKAASINRAVQKTNEILYKKLTVQNANGVKSASTFKMPAHFSELSSLACSILRTLIYADLFEYPLKADEIHEGLIASQASLTDVIGSLHASSLEKYIENSNGFYFLKGKKSTIENRKFREKVSQTILFKNRRILQFICNFPFVQAAALSGAMAFKNCLPDDDIDLFLIVNSRRIWSVYLFLAAFLKLTGKRNLICLNYLYAKKDLTVDEKDFFIAHQIANLRFLYGTGIYQEFCRFNDWLREYLPQAEPNKSNFISKKFVTSTRIKFNGFEPACKRIVEKLFGLRAFDKIEQWVFQLYGGHIRKMTAHKNGSVKVEKDVIKLFTNDHRQKIIHKFQRRLKEIEEEIEIEN